MRIEVPQIDPTLWLRLNIEAKHRGIHPSILLSQALQQFLGISNQEISQKEEEDRIFARLAGTWTQEDVDEFEQNTEDFRQIDPDIWE
ncbi:MAG: hypothetical protein AAFV78_14680 [Bacteroidota bacterium]